ncbi:DUF1648 domain-containing protein [Streptomyces sp. MS06]|uniref:DUF1648 domain-containing protein n=1 Tax=Streptomyces sp. MS06 TaxID=3385974 RepID=UPI0039A21785
MRRQRRMIGLVLTAHGLGAAAALGTFAYWHDRLPDPMATHFSGGGRPDGYTGLAEWPWVAAAVLLAVGGLTAGVLWAGSRRDGLPRAMTATVAGIPGFIGWALAAVPLTNLDVTDASAAKFDPILLPVMILTAAALGGLVWWLAGPDPDGRPAVPEPVAPLALGAGERAMWSRRAGSRSLVWLSAALLVAAAALAALWQWLPAAVLLSVAVIAGASALVRVVVDDGGLSLVWFGLPRFRKRIPLERIEAAGSRRVAAFAEFGGWGYRVRPGSRGLVLHSGEALSLRLRTGKEFVVTVEDSAGAASLLNALIARRRTEG